MTNTSPSSPTERLWGLVLVLGIVTFVVALAVLPAVWPAIF